MHRKYLHTQIKKKLCVWEFCISEIVTCAEMCICVFVHSADLWFLHLEKYLRCRFAQFVHSRFFAHLQNLCIYILWTCAESFSCAKCFFRFSDLSKCFCECLRMTNFLFSRNFTEFANLSKKCQNVEKVEISENVRKCPEKSSRVPEWYTSGSWANAFDNTGWQKSPEYALIRIAAGAPDLAKSGQIRPRTAPDGKSSRIWRRFRFCSTGWNPVRSCFFLTRAQLVRVVKRIPRRVEFCDRVRHILQMCAHFAKHSLKTAVRAQDILHTVHTVHNRNRHTCTNCAHPKHRRAHLCTPRHNPRHIGREHIVHVLLLLGGGGERTHPFV